MKMQILIIVAIFVFAQQVVATTKWSAKFTPNTTTVPMDTQTSVWLDLTNIDVTRSDYVFQVCSETPLLATVLHNNITAQKIDVTTASWSGNITVNAIFLGATNVYVQLVDLKTNQIERNTQDLLRVIIIRKMRIIDHIFTGSVALLVSLLYINFGAALEVGVLRNLIIRPIGPTIGLLTQFLLMPLLSYAIGMLLFSDSVEMQIGLFFTGVSPSGGASNIWTVVLDGNINLSILMTAIGNFAAFFMMPLWLFTLGVKIFERGSMEVPYDKIATFAISLVVPLAIGLAIQRWSPRTTRWLVRVLKPVSTMLILFIIIFATVTNLYLFKLFSWKIAVAGLALPYAGYILSWIIAKGLRQRPADALTIAIETGIQNTGIAIFLLRFSLDQPQADLTTVIPVAVAIMTPLPLLALYLFRRSNKKPIDGDKLSDEGTTTVEEQRMYGAI